MISAIIQENILEIGPFSGPFEPYHKEKAWFRRQPDLSLNFSSTLSTCITWFDLGHKEPLKLLASPMPFHCI